VEPREKQAPLAPLELEKHRLEALSKAGVRRGRKRLAPLIMVSHFAPLSSSYPRTFLCR